MLAINNSSDPKSGILTTSFNPEERISSIVVSNLVISNTSSFSKSLLLDKEAEKNQTLLEQIKQAVLESDHDFLKEILSSLTKDQSKALVNSANSEGERLLNLCATTGDIQTMTLLLEYGADPSLVNDKRENFVHCLLLYEQLEMLSALLKIVPSDIIKDLVNAVDSEGDSPLFYCIFDKSLPYIILLLDAGANPLQTNADKENLLHRVIAGERPELLQALLRRLSQDSTFSRESFDQLLNAGDKDGETPLYYCSSIGDVSSAKLLLKYKADPLISNHSGEFPYNEAVELRHESVARILRESNPKVEGTFSLLILGNVFGVELEPILSGKKAPFQGSSRYFMHHLISQTLQKPLVRKNFFSSCNQEQYDELCAAVTGASVRNPPLKEMVQKIHTGKLVIFVAGWEDHAISLIFRDGYLVICNRGEGCFDDERNDRMFFVRKISAEQVSEELLKKALSFANAHVDISKRFFYEELPQTLSGIEDDYCKRIVAIQPKPIYVNICGYASAKAALRGALALLIKDPESARAATKAWGTWHREWALDYFQKTPSPFETSFCMETITVQAKRLSIRKQIHLMKSLYKLKKQIANGLPLDKILNEIESFYGEDKRKNLESCLWVICKNEKIKRSIPFFGRTKFLDIEFSRDLKQQAVDMFIQQLDPNKIIRKKLRKRTELMKSLYKLKNNIATRLPLDGILNEIGSFYGENKRTKLESCLWDICKNKKIKRSTPFSSRSKFLDPKFSRKLKQQAVDLFIEQIDPKKTIRIKIGKS